MVTSALRWPAPLERAVFVVDHPASWGNVDVSYRVQNRATSAGRTRLVIVEQPFLPNREVTVRWNHRMSNRR